MGKRNLTLDVAKGLGIILVVIGHICRRDSEGWEGQWIYSFHMPLFFFLSGYLFKDEAVLNMKQFVRSKTRSLFIPTCLLALVYLMLSYLFTGESSYSCLLKGFPYGLWFVFVLYLALILWAFTLRKAKTWAVMVSVAMLILGLTFRQYRIESAYSLTAVPMAVFYLWLGYFLKKQLVNQMIGLKYVIPGG